MALGHAEARAQVPSPDVPSFTAAAAPTPERVEAAVPATGDATLRLRPIEMREVYVGHAVPAGGFANVIPPAPRIVSRMMLKPVGSGSVQVNSNFGYRRDPITGSGRMHTGVDLKAGYGESVGASLGGKVAFAGYRGGYGNLVILDHGRGIATYYAHLLSISVAVGQSVVPGQAVGLAGSTGRSTGPHLHYEVRANGIPLNPTSTITFKGSQIFADGRAVSGKPVDGGDEDDAPQTASKDAKAAEKPRYVGPIFQSADSLSNY
jgi:murein DD-endopeptidase MepM/ murein hydrolase activator NlpD